MSKKQSIAHKALFLLLLFLLAVRYSVHSAFADIGTQDKNVLILNSYHQGLAWTRDETAGIIDTLNKSNFNYSISVEYMDWKNYPTEDNLNFLLNYFQYKYLGKPVDILITTDDAALRFALEYRSSLFANAPIVFCGVNQNTMTQLTDGFDNFTGVIETVDPEPTIEMALTVNPSLKKVYVLFDNSESGISTGTMVIDKINSLNKGLATIPLNNMPYDELIKAVENYEKDSIILVTTYYGDVSGKVLEFEKVSREIGENSSVPVYHLYDFGINNGAFGGSMLSGKLQGENAADLAIRILNGESADAIPIISPKTTWSAFDYTQLKRFNIPLSSIPNVYEVINKPFSFFETYKNLVLSVSAAFAVLALFIFILLFYLRKINRMKEKLSNNHEELTQIYEELAASDEELRQQFDELSSVKENLANSEERFRIAADGSNAAIWDVDMASGLYHFSDRWYELLGYANNEINESGGGWRNIIHPEDTEKAAIARNLHLEGKTPFYNAEYRMKSKSGSYIWFNVRGKVLKDSAGNNIRFAGSLIDISDRKSYEIRLQASYEELETTYEELTAAQEELTQQYHEILNSNEKIRSTEEKLVYLAYHDPLTGLPNKLAIYEKANRDIFFDSRSKAALFFIDMDNFKYINDTMGHASGDQLIIKASERLSSLLKDNCSLYRLSGDEFVIIMKNAAGKEEAQQFASAILAGFKEAFNVLDSEIHMSISIGIVVYPHHGQDIEELIKNADIAMYQAKEAGKNRYSVYDPIMNDVFMERVNIEKHMHTALSKNEFEVYYQPQLELTTNKITGLEALLRWNSPELGFVSPLKFIKVAEDTHLIIPLGAWVLKNACAFLKMLHNKGYTELTMSVNVSIIQLLQPDFNRFVTDTLDFFNLEPHHLELEITESILMESFETIGSKLEKLREKGVRIALDDFGKGYSSLNYLKQLPISTLKIDKSFVDNICLENDILTKHIVTIGKSMGMCVIAEGVEKQEQLDYLIRYECHKIQGFLFSKPIKGEQIIELLNKQK